MNHNHIEIKEDFKASTTKQVKKNSPKYLSLFKTHRPRLFIFRVSFLGSLIYYMCFWVLCFDRFVSDLEIGLEVLRISSMGFDFHSKLEEFWFKNMEKK